MCTRIMDKRFLARCFLEVFCNKRGKMQKSIMWFSMLLWMQLARVKHLLLWSARCSVCSQGKLVTWCASVTSCLCSCALTELQDNQSRQAGLKKCVIKKKKGKRKCHNCIRDWLCMQLFGRTNKEIISVPGRRRGRVIPSKYKQSGVL